MTPYQLAKQECANLLPDGECLGIHHASLLDNGQQKFANPLASCLLKESKRCEYFEAVVLPLADSPSPHDDPGLQVRRLEAREEYHGTQGRATPKAGKVRHCPECGKPLAKRQKICSACKIGHRRERTRKSVQKHRLAVSAFVEKDDCKSLSIKG